ncbi:MULTISPECIES: DUF6480 family protein [Amycolatopsis]|uniref:Uncharacterized protein n=2 Tax=Amycolatopsis TaxID=1813 RepID=A0A1I3Z5W2_9PSEU|nr:DUF6480 family protein [Amycolatopsis sacchari]SFK39498.1 hypothetical protein SAMN05421835_12013 [Amycolatopsis sacchari]
MSNPDPEPDRTPGLEPGGGVQPGDTPPDSGSTTLGLSHHEPDQHRSVPVIAIVLSVVLAVLVAALLVSLAVGWLRF